MASVSKSKDRPGYTVRWRDETGKQGKRSFARKTDADRYAAEIEHTVNVGSYIDARAGRQSFRDYAEAWRAAQPHRPNTAGRVKSQLDDTSTPPSARGRSQPFRPTEVQAFVSSVSTALAPGSVRTLFATVSAVFGAAVRDRLVALDPTERIALPGGPRGEGCTAHGGADRGGRRRTARSVPRARRGGRRHRSAPGRAASDSRSADVDFLRADRSGRAPGPADRCSAVEEPRRLPHDPDRKGRGDRSRRAPTGLPGSGR